MGFAGEGIGPGGDPRMSLVFTWHFRGYPFFVYTRWIGIGREGPVLSDGVLKGHLYAWIVQFQGSLRSGSSLNVSVMPVLLPGSEIYDKNDAP